MEYNDILFKEMGPTEMVNLMNLSVPSIDIRLGWCCGAELSRLYDVEVFWNEI